MGHTIAADSGSGKARTPVEAGPLRHLQAGSELASFRTTLASVHLRLPSNPLAVQFDTSAPVNTR